MRAPSGGSASWRSLRRLSTSATLASFSRPVPPRPLTGALHFAASLIETVERVFLRVVGVLVAFELTAGFLHVGTGWAIAHGPGRRGVG